MTQRRDDKPHWCDICCCELNTEKMLEIHKSSPKHLKKEDALSTIAQFKEEYLKFKQDNPNASYWDKVAAENSQNNFIRMTNDTPAES